MRGISKWFTVCCLTLPPLISYLAWGPAIRTGTPTTLSDHLVSIIRHGDTTHLLTNLCLLATGGWLTASRLGALPTLALAALFAVVGTLAELLIVGPGFVGASGVAYGLVAYWAVASAPSERSAHMASLIVLALLAEAALLKQIAVFTHVVPALTGGGLAMLSLFNSKGPSLIPMKWEHVSAVVQIIAQTDEDDAEEAEASFLDNGYENMFVVKNKGKVIGVTGYSLDENTPDLAWLSWTYLDEAEQRQGFGSFMINEMLGRLAKMGIRKAFIESSDYVEDGQKIYAAAHKLYEDFGANLELTVPDFHAPGEAKLVFGIDNPEAPKTDVPDPDTATGLSFDDYAVAPETDDVAGLSWSAAPSGIVGLEELCAKLPADHRMAVFAAPSDLTRDNHAALSAAKFKHLGTLKGYYGTGLGQDWWARQL